jgi:ribosome-associated protein
MYMKRRGRENPRPPEDPENKDSAVEFDWKNGEIPESEVTLRATRSSGPGGQSVNKTSSNVEVRWKIADSKVLSDKQKEVLREKGSHRVTKSDEIIFTSQSEKSQLQNRRTALANLSAFVRETLKVRKKRKPTRKSKGAKAKDRRGDEARRRIKERREKPKDWD